MSEVYKRLGGEIERKKRLEGNRESKRVRCVMGVVREKIRFRD